MVSEAYAYRNGSDPDFYDEGDWVKCEICKRDYDFKEYKSMICVDCENEGYQWFG